MVVLCMIEDHSPVMHLLLEKELLWFQEQYISGMSAWIAGSLFNFSVIRLKYFNELISG